MKIEVGKRYVTRNGDVVLIDQTGFPDEFGTLFEFSGVCLGVRQWWRGDGAFTFAATDFDLIREHDQQPANFNITITIQAETPEGYRAALTALGEGV